MNFPSIETLLLKLSKPIFSPSPIPWCFSADFFVYNEIAIFAIFDLKISFGENMRKTKAMVFRIVRCGTFIGAYWVSGQKKYIWPEFWLKNDKFFVKKNRLIIAEK